MMSARKIQHPVLREVLVTSLQLVLGLIGGVLICAVWLMWKPVTVMDNAPSANREVTDRHEVVYVRGRPASRGAQSVRKHKAFLAQTPGQLVFIEEDLNRWLAGAYGSKELAFPIKGTGVTITPRIPAARLLGEELELGLEIAVERGDQVKTFIVQTRGRFGERDGRAVFVPREVYFGSCPLPWNLGGRLVYNKLASLYPVPEKVDAAWSAVSNATVAEKRLRLHVGPASASVPEVATPDEPETIATPVVIDSAPPPQPAAPVNLPAATAENAPAPAPAAPAETDETAAVSTETIPAPAPAPDAAASATTEIPVASEPATPPPPTESTTETPVDPASAPATEPSPASTEAVAPEAAPAPPADEVPAGPGPSEDPAGSPSPQEETAPAAPTP